MEQKKSKEEQLIVQQKSKILIKKNSIKTKKKDVNNQLDEDISDNADNDNESTKVSAMFFLNHHFQRKKSYNSPNPLASTTTATPFRKFSQYQKKTTSREQDSLPTLISSTQQTQPETQASYTPIQQRRKLNNEDLINDLLQYRCRTKQDKAYKDHFQLSKSKNTKQVIFTNCQNQDLSNVIEKFKLKEAKQEMTSYDIYNYIYQMLELIETPDIQITSAISIVKQYINYFLFCKKQKMKEILKQININKKLDQFGQPLPQPNFLPEMIMVIMENFDGFCKQLQKQAQESLIQEQKQFQNVKNEELTLIQNFNLQKIAEQDLNIKLLNAKINQLKEQLNELEKICENKIKIMKDQQQAQLQEYINQTSDLKEEIFKQQQEITEYKNYFKKNKINPKLILCNESPTNVLRNNQNDQQTLKITINQVYCPSNQPSPLYKKQDQLFKLGKSSPRRFLNSPKNNNYQI